MFPAEPFEQSYRSVQSQDPEASPLLNSTPDVRSGATEEEFVAALDRERNKVIDFYKETEKDLEAALDLVLSEVRVLEDRELEDVIEEEEEGFEDVPEPTTDAGDLELGHGLEQSTDTLTQRPPPSPRSNNNLGFIKSLQSRFLTSSDPQRDEADLLEASLTPQVQNAREGSRNRSRSTAGVRRNRMMRNPSDFSHGRRTSDEIDRRRMSASSASSGGMGAASRYRGNLGLVPMTEPTPLTESIFSHNSSAGFGSNYNQPRLSGDNGDPVDYIWTASSDYGKVLRIGFKKRIARIWLDGHALRGFAELNMTAFEKILKK
jgi:phosphate transporter